MNVSIRTAKLLLETEVSEFEFWVRTAEESHTGTKQPTKCRMKCVCSKHEFEVFDNGFISMLCNTLVILLCNIDDCNS